MRARLLRSAPDWRGRGAASKPRRKLRQRCCSSPPACTPTGLTSHLKACGLPSKRSRSSRPISGSRPYRKTGTKPLARRLEGQAAEDGNDPFQEHQWNGLWRRLRLDGCEYGTMRLLPSGYELQAVSHRQIPLGPANNGGGCHGAQWHNGKLWIYATRIGLLRVDPKTWQPEFLIPVYRSEEISRYHDLAFDKDGAIWQMVGRNSTRFADNWQALVKYDAATGRMLEIAEFLPGICGPAQSRIPRRSVYRLRRRLASRLEGWRQPLQWRYLPHRFCLERAGYTVEQAAACKPTGRRKEGERRGA